MTHKTVHRIKVNRWPWAVRVPRWFAMRVWLWLPGEWHGQSVTSTPTPGPVVARSLMVDAMGWDKPTARGGADRSTDPCPEWQCPDLSTEDRREGETCPEHPCTCAPEAICEWTVGPVWKLDGETCVCVLAPDHTGEHECSCGSWFSHCGRPSDHLNGSTT